METTAEGTLVIIAIILLIILFVYDYSLTVMWKALTKLRNNKDDSVKSPKKELGYFTIKSPKDESKLLVCFSTLLGVVTDDPSEPCFMLQYQPETKTVKILRLSHIEEVPISQTRMSYVRDKQQLNQEYHHERG